MTVLRSFLASIGLALAGLGLLFVVVPDAARLLPLSRLGVLLLGIVALVQAVRSLRARWLTPVEGAVPPEPETRHETARPGDDFDERVAALASRSGRRWHGPGYERLRQRLQAAAVEATAHRWRLTDAAARERVAAGEWTEDPAAAWFIGGPSVPPPPWPVRARALLESRAAVAFYANRTADAIVTLREAS